MATLAEKGGEDGECSLAAIKELVAKESRRNGVPETYVGEDDNAYTALGLWYKYPSITACSILGSYLAQEVIKTISRTEPPNFNTSVCAGEGTGVVVYPICDEMQSPYL